MNRPRIASQTGSTTLEHRLRRGVRPGSVPLTLPALALLAVGCGLWWPAPSVEAAGTTAADSTASEAKPASKVKAPSVKIEVLGVKGVLRKNVQASLSIADKKRRKGATEAQLRNLHAKADDEIRRALQPFGYYRPFIRSELKTDGRWVAQYEIEQGAPLLVDSILVDVTGEGDADPRYQQLAREFPLHKGDVLVHPRYEAGKAALESYAAEGGYLDARFTTSRVEVDLERYAATVLVRFDTGPRHVFGSVSFDRDVIDPGLLAQYPTFRSGQIFDFRKLLELQTDLSGTGYFTRVEVTPGTEVQEHRHVPIEVSLSPARRFRFTGGVGYGTDDGARVRSLIELRRANRQGHRAQLELQYGQRDRRAGIQYFIPWPRPRTDVVTLSSGYQYLSTITSTSRIFQNGISESRLLGQWRATAAVNYRQERFTLATERGHVKTLVPEGTWIRIRTDDQLDTRNGDRVRFNVRGAHEAVLSDVSLIQPRVDGKLIHAFGPRIRGLTRIEVAGTRTNDFSRMPPSLRYFAGGTNSVRGYGYNSLGPRDSLGNVIGGRHLVAGSVELDYRVLPRYGVAAFYDMGNAVNSFRDPLKRGVGAGLRWVSPAGLVRVDFGWALDRTGRPLTIHLAMGPEL